MQIAQRKLGVQFGWNGKNSAYQNLQAQRSRIGNYLGNTRSALASIGSALTSAATNKISGMATLAGQAAVDRIQAELKTALASRDKQLASAQDSLAQTQANYNGSGLTLGDLSTGNVLNTSA